MSQHADLGHARTESADAIRSAVGEEDPSEGKAVDDGAARPGLPGTPAWLSWGLSLLLVAGFMTALSYAYQMVQRSAEGPLLRIVVNGETLELDGQDKRAFMFEAALRIEEIDVVSAHQAWINEKGDAAFAPLDSGVDKALDWHFSALASYSRVALGVARALDYSDDRYEKEMLSRLQVAETEAALRELEGEFKEMLDKGLRSRLQGIQEELYEQYVARQVTSPKGDEVRVIKADLDALLHEITDPQRDLKRLGGVGSAAGSVLVAPGLARRLAAGPALQGARASAARFVTRMGVNLSRAVVIGGASAPTGPVAPVVALTTLVAGEYAALSFEESKYRPDMEAQLRADVTLVKDHVTDMMFLAAQEHFASRADHLKESLKAMQEAATKEYRIVDWRWRPGFD